MDTDTSNESQSQGCYNMTAEELSTVKAVEIGATSFICLVCAIAILLIIFLRAYKSCLVRLVLYLNLTLLCVELAQITEVLPVESVNNSLVIHNKDLCTATAFTGLFFLTLTNLTWCSMALYLILLTASKNKNLHTRGREIWGVITVVTIAIVTASIPLIPFDGDTAYGLDRFVCWIDRKNEDCEWSTVGLTEIIILVSIPNITAQVFTMIALVFAVRALCKKPKSHSQHQALQEARTLLVYMSILAIAFLIVAIFSALSFERHTDVNLPLAGLAISGLLPSSIPAAFIFHPTTLKRLRCSELKQTVNKWRGIHDEKVYTSYHVPQEPEFSECSDLVIRGSDRNKHHSGYKTMLEQPNTEEVDEPV